MILFFLLSFICILTSILLITNKNPVYSVLNLVLLFVSGSILLLLLGVDFIPFVFIVVYVGAVAVLFLFVVIILDIKLSTNTNIKSQIPYIFLISLFVFFFLNYVSQPYKFLGAPIEIPSTEYKHDVKAYFEFLYGPISESVSSKVPNEWTLFEFLTSHFSQWAKPEPEIYHVSSFESFYNDSGTSLSSLNSLGQLLYTEYVLHFVICGLILLVAIIGAIVLTSKSSKTSLKQKVFKQSERLHIVGKNK